MQFQGRQRVLGPGELAERRGRMTADARIDVVESVDESRHGAVPILPSAAAATTRFFTSSSLRLQSRREWPPEGRPMSPSDAAAQRRTSGTGSRKACNSAGVAMRASTPMPPSAMIQRRRTCSSRSLRACISAGIAIRASPPISPSAAAAMRRTSGTAIDQGVHQGRDGVAGLVAERTENGGGVQALARLDVAQTFDPVRQIRLVLASSRRGQDRLLVLPDSLCRRTARTTKWSVGARSPVQVYVIVGPGEPDFLFFFHAGAVARIENRQTHRRCRMNLADDRDEWIMVQAANGQPHLLEILVRRHASPLLTFIHRMVGDRHRSEELFQEVFLSVWLNRARYQFPRPFKPWLYAIALNKCREAHRGRTQPTQLLADGDAAPLSAEASPLECAVASESAQLVSQAVTQLPPQQRAVVVLRIWDNLAYADIAEIVGCSEATARSHMVHGLASLRRLLEPRLGEQASVRTT